MLRWLILKNFKAFGGEERIPLAPLTLIFGRNSAGKSSILQSILFLKQSAASLASGGEAKWVGDDVDLGSMPHALHLQGKHPDHRTLSVGAIFGTWDWEAGRCNDDPDNAPVGVEFTWGVRDVGVARREAERQVRWAAYAGEETVPALRGVVGDRREAPATELQRRFNVGLLNGNRPFGSTSASFDRETSYLQSLYRAYQKPLEDAFETNLKTWQTLFEQAQNDERALAVVSPIVAYWRANEGDDRARDAVRALRWVKADLTFTEPPPDPGDVLWSLKRAKTNTSFTPVRKWFGPVPFKLNHPAIFPVSPTGVLFIESTIQALSDDYYWEAQNIARFGRDLQVSIRRSRQSFEHLFGEEELSLIQTLISELIYNSTRSNSYFRPESQDIANTIGGFLTTISVYFPELIRNYSNILFNDFMQEWLLVQGYDEASEQEASRRSPVHHPSTRILRSACEAGIDHLPTAIDGLDFRTMFDPSDRAAGAFRRLGESVRHVKAVREQLPRIAEATHDPNSPRLLDRLVDRAGRLGTLNTWLKQLGLEYTANVQPERTIASQKSLPTLPRWSFTLTHTSNKTILGMQDVGFGVGQVIPVAIEVATLGDGILLLEQPELHLHPAMQATVGQMLADAVQASKTGQIIAETHSEHLVLRMMRLVRERKLSHTSLQILYVDQDADGKSTVVELPLDKYGEFEADWPRGFFDERLNEL